jgi:hypothetical protein
MGLQWKCKVEGGKKAACRFVQEWSHHNTDLEGIISVPCHSGNDGVNPLVTVSGGGDITRDLLINHNGGSSIKKNIDCKETCMDMEALEKVLLVHWHRS